MRLQSTDYLTGRADGIREVLIHLEGFCKAMRVFVAEIQIPTGDSEGGEANEPPEGDQPASPR